MGPLLIAVTAQLTGKSSTAVFSLIILFVIGIVILAFVPEEPAQMSASSKMTCPFNWEQVIHHLFALFTFSCFPLTVVFFITLRT